MKIFQSKRRAAILVMRKISLLVTCALLLITIAACWPATYPADNAESETAIKIAVVPKSLDNPFFDSVKEAAMVKAEELGITLEWTGSAVVDTAEQISVLEGLIGKGVDGILVSCNEAEALKDVLNKAADAGIAVATFDSDSYGSKRAFYIGSDNKKIGIQCAETINELLPDGGKVAVLSGVADAPNLNERIAGFQETANGNISILPIEYCGENTQRAVDIIRKITAENLDLAGWVFIGSWPLYADPEELPELQVFAENGGVCIGVDSEEAILRYVELGIVRTLIGQNSALMGSDGVQYLYDIIMTGKKPPSDLIDTGYEIIDKNNVAKAFANK